MRPLVDVCRFSKLNDAIYKYVKRTKWSRADTLKFGEKFERVPVLFDPTLTGESSSRLSLDVFEFVYLLTYFSTSN
jgi:hypothetical protein